MEEFSYRKIFFEWLTGGIANALTSGFLNPIDIAKTRIQVCTLNKKSLTGTLTGIYKESGLIGLWKPGLNASMLREMLSSGPRAGFYVPVRDNVNKYFGETESLRNKVIAAIITGTIGSIISNPVDVVKIRMMTDSTRYRSVLSGVGLLYAEEGIAGLAKGVIPSTLRGASIAAGELATYDHTKSSLKKYMGREEGILLHGFASMITGIVATTVAAPFDMLKSRMMNGIGDKTVMSLLRDSLLKEGFSVLFKGWLPAYMRLGPHALICFPLFEQLRNIAGLKYL